MTGREIGYLSSNGYKMISMTRESGTGSHKMLVHRLVYLVYKGKVEQGIEVNHIDGLVTNPRLRNLDLRTPSGNMQHAYDTGLKYGSKGESNGQAKFDDDLVARIRKYYATHDVSARELAKHYGVANITFRWMLHSKTWKHVKSGFEDRCIAKMKSTRTSKIVDVELIKKLRRQELSSYEISRRTGYARGTVIKYW